MNGLYLRIFLLVLFLSVFGMPPASAATWHVVVEVGQGVVYVDIDSVRKNADNIIFWNDDRLTSGQAAGKKTTCLTEAAFLHGQAWVRDLQCIHYDKNGNPYNTDQAGSWETITPGSAMEAAVKVAAQYAR